jgi:hypothetical protein
MGRIPVRTNRQILLMLCLANRSIEDYTLPLNISFLCGGAACRERVNTWL